MPRGFCRGAFSFETGISVANQENAITVRGALKEYGSVKNLSPLLLSIVKETLFLVRLNLEEIITIMAFFKTGKARYNGK